MKIPNLVHRLSRETCAKKSIPIGSLGYLFIKMLTTIRRRAIYEEIRVELPIEQIR